MLLTSINPFRNTIVRDAWEPIIDVESINKHVSDYILEMIQNVKETKETEITLVEGEPGIGKSHLLARIRQYSETTKNFLFISIPPISDVQNLFLHIYREIFVSLRKKWNTESYTPLEFMLSSIMASSILHALEKKRSSVVLPEKSIKFLITKLQKDPLSVYKILAKNDENSRELRNITENLVNEYLNDEYPDIDFTFMKILYLTLESDKKFLALRWLQGDELSQEDLEKLGIEHTISDENMAFRVLRTVTQLSPHPFLLCFDQLESLYARTGDPQILNSFFDTLVRIHDHTKNCAILLMVQSATWDQIKNQIQQSALDRITENLSLLTPTTEELLLIVEKRLEPLWEKCPHGPPFKTYPFTREYILKIAESVGHNPRWLIKALAADIQNLKRQGKVDIFDVTTFGAKESEKLVQKKAPTVENINNYIKSRLDELMADFAHDKASYPPLKQEEFLRDALRDFFNALKQFNPYSEEFELTEISPRKRANDLDFVVTILYPKRKVKFYLGLQFSNTEDGRKFYSAVTKIHNNLRYNKIQKWILIRNEDLELKGTWKRSLKILDELKRKGRLIRADFSSIAFLIASKRLLDAAAAGDLSLNGTSLTYKQVSEILIKNFYFNVDLIQQMLEIITKKISFTSKPKVADTETSKDRMLKKAQKTLKEVIKRQKDETQETITDVESVEAKVIDFLETSPVTTEAKIAEILKIDSTVVKQAVTNLLEKEAIILVKNDQNRVISKAPKNDDII